MSDSFTQHNIETEIPDLSHHHATSVAVELPAEHPSVTLDEFDLAVVFQIHHCLGSFKAQQTSTDDDASRTLLVRREGDEPLQVINRPVYKDTIRIVSWGVLWKNGIGASSQNQDVVWYCLTL